jgi:acetyl-CoA carboxylase biotin carboxyl carrier protein
MTDDARPTPDPEFVRSLLHETHDLARRLEGSSVLRVSVQVGEYRIEIERGQVAASIGPAVAAPPWAGTQPGAVPADLGRAQEDDTRFPIVAPLLGTFYRSAKPGAKAFVEEGDVVDQGQTVGIVEAMKIMNNVLADRRGRIVEIVAKNAEWVEFQQPLMYVEPIDG